MPTVKELNIQLENKPGTLAKLCNALAGRKVNIVAFQASAAERRSQVHLVVDNLAAAKTVLGAEGSTFTETDVAQWRVLLGGLVKPISTSTMLTVE
ncbi:MAG: hypothetical protein DMG49_16710 [Acidobacteria bacterium]|nr:MAG: hypothetical protein DMG49_16710 [Acidobacteriota bacterium]